MVTVCEVYENGPCDGPLRVGDAVIALRVVSTGITMRIEGDPTDAIAIMESVPAGGAVDFLVIRVIFMLPARYRTSIPHYRVLLSLAPQLPHKSPSTAERRGR